MTLLQAIVLGVIQGLTEFLPVSSSGHLVISQNFFGLNEPGIAFDISVHLGTLAAVLIFFKRQILEVNAAGVSGCRKLFTGKATLSSLFSGEPGFRLAILLAAGSVPTALIGIVLQFFAEELFTSLALTGGMLMLTGVILVLTGVLLWVTRRAGESGRGLSGFTMGVALAIGTVQGFAIIPGISRSGSTIAAGLLLGLDRETAGTYSFLLSIPAIIGAALLHLVMGGEGSFSFQVALVGATVSFGVGFLSLGFLMRILKGGRIHLFAPYCLVVGLVVMFLGL